MLVFIDESGSFSGFDRSSPTSLAAVGALSVPHRCMAKLAQKYEKLRKRFPLDQGEVKGRLLNELHIAAVVDLLRKNNAVLELSVADVGAHSEEGVRSYRDTLAADMEERKPRFNADTQVEVAEAVRQIRKCAPQLFLQAMVTMDVLERLIVHIPMYFAQRHPQDLGVFEWIVDAKDRDKTTDWERWWSTYCWGVLAARSKLRPGAVLSGADYTHFNAAFGGMSGSEEGTDMRILMSNCRFSPEPEFGLEMVDIVTNAVRRALTGNLGEAGWCNIPRLMIHRGEHYIGLMLLEGAAKMNADPEYGDVVRRFSRAGRPMLTPAFQRLADEDP